jgi:hypothetical protein
VPGGVDARRFPAHQIVCWLAKWLRIAPYVELEIPRFKKADPRVMGGKV